MLTGADAILRPILIIGVGNDYRGDDCAGLRVARALAAMKLSNARIVELPGEGTELIEAWRGRGRVIVIDASSSGAAPGTVIRLDVKASALPPGFFSYSTHAFGLAEAIETSRNLNALPEELVIYAIEGGNFAQGADVSTHVEEAVRDVADMIVSKLERGRISCS